MHTEYHAHSYTHSIIYIHITYVHSYIPYSGNVWLDLMFAELKVVNE